MTLLPTQMSVGRLLRLSILAGSAIVLISANGTTAKARTFGTEPGVRAANTAPNAPRGGVMMFALTRNDADAPWPARVSVKLSDGRELEGLVGVIGPKGLDDIAWTDDPRQLAIRSPLVGNDRARAGHAVALVRLPEDGNGPVWLGRQRLEPVWHDRPIDVVARTDHPALTREPALDRPDPDSPFEQWRWVLLAERLDGIPPRFVSDEPLQVMLADHFVQLWRIGLARLATEHPGLAQHVRELLTRVCEDDGVSFAAWVADPARTSSLLSLLLQTRRPVEAVAEDVVKWAEEQDRVRFWIESDSGDVVRLALVNPGTSNALVRFDWVDSDVPPLAVEVESGRLRHVAIDRPVLEEPVYRRPLDAVLARSSRKREPDILSITMGGHSIAVPMRPRSRAITPPGYWLPPLRPPLTLAEVQGVPAAPIPAESATIAHLRRLGGRWEVFIESRRPSDPAPAGEPDRGRHGWNSVESVRGTEAVIVSIGPSPAEEANVLVIPEEGWYEVVQGASDGTLQIHRRSYEDRWFCRVVLPDDWVGLLPGEQTQLSVMRSRRGTTGLDASPMPLVPWRTDAAGAVFDLSTWTDVPLGP